LRSVFAAVVYGSTIFERLPVQTAVPVADTGGELPVVVFSHGMGGNRFIYSYFCCRLAALGFVVMVVEHTDGLSSAARMAGKRGWLFYKGWGGPNFADACTTHRVAEVHTAMEVLRALQQHGCEAKHVSTAGRMRKEAAAVLEALQGRLGVDSVALAGHSFGGATMAGARSTPCFTVRRSAACHGLAGFDCSLQQSIAPAQPSLFIHMVWH
jgi:platelet-activating factor acetylhydrolase